MIRNEKRLRLCTALLICNLIFIWGNSLLPGEISGAFSDWIKEILEALLPGDGENVPGGGLLRKLAHFTEFACLGALLAWHSLLREEKHIFAFPALLGMAAGLVDETIQLFTPDRGPSLTDVWIDTSGALTGIMLLILGHHLIKRKQNH